MPEPVTSTTQTADIGSSEMEIAEFELGWKSPGVGRGNPKLIRNRSPAKLGIQLDTAYQAETQTTENLEETADTFQDVNGSISYDSLLENFPFEGGKKK